VPINAGFTFEIFQLFWICFILYQARICISLARALDDNGLGTLGADFFFHKGESMMSPVKKFAMAAGLMGMLVTPAMIHSDGFNFNVRVGDDDEAHFHFGGHHNPLIMKAARQLQNAKHTLWEARDDFHGHKAAAVQAINAALDELRMAEEHRH
jgi:hypothetical protein